MLVNSREYKASLKALEIEEYFDLWIFRPLGFIVAKAVQPIGITPNQLTVLAMICGICSGYVFSIGTLQAFLWGAFFYFLFNVLDCSDGQLARIKRSSSVAGKILDGAADYVAGIAIYTGIGIGYVNYFPNPAVWWVLLVLAALFNTIHSIVIDSERFRFTHHAWGRPHQLSNDLEYYKLELHRLRNIPGTWFERFVLNTYLVYLNISRFFHKPPKNPNFIYDPGIYYRKFRKLMKAWTFLGPTTHITIIIVSCIFMRPDIAAWIILVPMNIYWLLLVLIQNKKLKSLHLISNPNPTIN
jgi:phosphatidylglycerophosphate synthase